MTKRASVDKLARFRLINQAKQPVIHRIECWHRIIGPLPNTSGFPHRIHQQNQRAGFIWLWQAHDWLHRQQININALLQQLVNSFGCNRIAKTRFLHIRLHDLREHPTVPVHKQSPAPK